MKTNVCNSIVILSECLGKYHGPKNEQIGHKFHFIGHYKGQKISQIIAVDDAVWNFNKSVNYLIFAEALELKGAKLFIKIKKAEELI